MLKETFCANYTRPAGAAEGKNPPCAECEWAQADHITFEQLAEAHQARKARLVVDRLKFRLYIYEGFKYACYQQKRELWAMPAGNRPSDYRGMQFTWVIAERERADPNYTLKPKRLPNPADVNVPELIKELQRAISHANNNRGRWNSIDFPLLSPTNIQALIDEIDRCGNIAAKAA